MKQTGLIVPLMLAGACGTASIEVGDFSPEPLAGRPPAAVAADAPPGVPEPGGGTAVPPEWMPLPDGRFRMEMKTPQSETRFVMPRVEPDPNVHYTMKTVEPDPDIDYTMIIVGGDGRRGPWGRD